ncbi:MAG TPA: Hsp70 family protein [Longimicrobium sp.]|nr:Hsp70 family protein [Longimicrobium sp.]
MTVCTVCRVAPLGGKDRFCFHCGARLRKLTLELPSLLVIDAERARQQVLWVEGRLVNAGQFPDRAHVLTPDVPWVQVFGETDGPAPDGGWELLPGAGTPVRLRVHIPGALPDDSPGPRRITLHARGEQDGEGRDDAQATLQLQKPPQALITWTDGADYCVDDGPAEVRGDLVVAEPWPAPLEVQSAVRWAEASLVPGEPARVSARIRGDALTTELGDGRPASVPLLLQMRFPGLEGWWEVSADLALRWPPLLVVFDEERKPAADGGISWRLPSGRRWRLALKFENRGGMDLVVRGAALEPELSSIYPLQRLPSEDAPWILGPGASRIITVLVDLPDEPVTIETSLRVTTSMSSQPELLVRLRVEAYHVPDFAGWVGIDFGTTSSCVSVWRQGAARPETGMLFGGYRVAGSSPIATDILPSSIRYRSRPAAHLRTWEIGARSRLAPGDVVLHSIKRHLGSDASLAVRYVDQQEDGELSPVEVAADIIEQLVLDAEARLQRRIRHCALTHPARFSIRALQELCAALKDRGIAVDPQLPEPVAAALHHVVRHPPAGASDYHLLVVDLGGGTSDLALLRIQDRFEDDAGIRRRSIRPELLSVTGNRWAGGDDITWAILERFFGRVDTDEAASKSLGSLNVEQVRLIRKALLSTPRNKRRSDSLLSEGFSLADKAKQKQTEGGSEAGDLGEELTEIIDAFLEESALLRMGRDLLKAAGVAEEGVHLLLVGQSWMNKHLQKRVFDAFPCAVIRPGEFTPQTLKAPVALGASLAHALSGHHDLGFDLDRTGIVRMPPARIGTLRLDPDTGAQVFFPLVKTDGAFESWQEVPIRLTRGRLVTIWENSGGSNELDFEIGGLRTSNPELRQIGVVRIGDHVPDAVEDGELVKGRLEIRLNREQQVELKIDPVAAPWILGTSPA